MSLRASLQAIGSDTARLERVISAAEPEASITVLLGELGNGKAFLAEQAAGALAERIGIPTEVIILPQPPRPASGVVSVFAAAAPTVFMEAMDDDPAHEDLLQDPAALAAILRDSLEQAAGGRALVLVAPNIDAYPARDIQILDALVQQRRLRIIATATTLSGAAGRIGGGARAHSISIGPIDIEEAATYLCALLGVEQIEQETLRRWYAVSGGNSYALAAQALASDQAGALRRSRGTAWVASGDDAVPGEFATVLAGSCTEEEWEALELIAQAEPILEPALLRSLDAACLSTLFERNLVKSIPRPGVGVSLMTGHSLLGASLRARISPLRRLQLNDQIFQVLDDARGTDDPRHTPDLLLRLVVFGIEGGRKLPASWLWAAFELVVRGGDPRLVLSLAMAIAGHADAEPQQAGTAVLLGNRIARTIGDIGSLRASLDLMRGLLDEPARAAGLSDMLRVGLQLAIIRQRVWDDDPVEEILAAHAALAEGLPEDEALAEQVRSSLVVVLAYTGRLREAAEKGPDPVPSGDLKTEWLRSPARAVVSLILEQRGEISAAIASAENARKLSQLGSRARPENVDFQGFCWLLGYWVGGSAEAARQVLSELEQGASATTHAETYYSGLVEAGAVLLAVQEGRWRDAAQSAERLLDRLSRHDSYGIAPLIQAALALALAVLGERDAAVLAIRAAELPKRGIGQALAGHRRLLTLRARQWLREGDVLSEAERLAEWAGSEGLALIELQAVHAIAFETRAAPPELVARARQLADAVDPPLGLALFSHIDRIAVGVAVGEGPKESEDPEVRLLAELGVWLPLPPAPGLTSREREVVLLAALGHSSKFIAERLHISVRTVETHLSNAFGKLSLDNRDDLRRWAGRERMRTL
ncbi:hypothetical protein G7067_03710 [Leucobacter insecticola]|uniref:HTH luxR-type domain-containing protein n=1 Tax=Leucobacter insecticola TaxID=2714934 RepID=A0A6G8FI52_9MICO|nr:LuxR family transcriptional regulator [Leucobacter insecticola]QIM15722.1 hypothetical protein G7067_03710 [Leucobacter insecticola]